MEDAKKTIRHTVQIAQISAERMEQSNSIGQEDQVQEEVSICGMFRFADRTDKILILIGTIGAIVAGCGFPVFFLLWGNILDNFQNNGQINIQNGRDTFIQFIYIGAIVLLGCTIMFGCWIATGERQTKKCKQLFFQSLLTQQKGWFDSLNIMELMNQFSSDSEAFQAAISGKFAIIVLVICTTLVRIGIALYQGWELALVVIAALPALLISGVVFVKLNKAKTTKEEESYKKAAAKSEQAMAALQTVKMLNGQKYQVNKYKELLNLATVDNVKFSIYTGLSIGGLFMMVFLAYTLGFWWGSKLIEDMVYNHYGPGNKYSAGLILSIVASIIMGFYFFTQITPNIQVVSQGKQAAKRIYNIIDRESKVVSYAEGIKLQNDRFKGHICFHGVSFAYPTAKDHKVLDCLDLDLDARTIAFAGQSGCGKSTILQLIMRFYDPDVGFITLDGVDLRDLDLYWLRTNIGYVQQHSILFQKSIRENVTLGDQNITDEQVEKALRASQAYQFVVHIETGLDTQISEGSNLSGGQKQRIAIARALAKKPKILLLDEATSALDNQNQSLVLQNLRKSYTSTKIISIAHFQKTIEASQTIFLFQKGNVHRVADVKEVSTIRDISKLPVLTDIRKKKSREIFVRRASLLLQLQKSQSNVQQQIDYGDQVHQDDVRADQDYKGEQMEDLCEDYEGSIFRRIFSYASDRIVIFVINIVLSIVAGWILPAFSVFFGRQLSTLLTFRTDPIAAREQVDRYSLIFVGISVAALLLKALQFVLFAIVGEDITQKIRLQTYSKLIRLPIPWFSSLQRSPGVLSNRLAVDCKVINGLMTTYIGIMIETVSTFVTAVVAAFIFEWRIALVVTGIVPFIFATGLIKMKFLTGTSSDVDILAKQSLLLMRETVYSLNTVHAFAIESKRVQEYSDQLDMSSREIMKNGVLAGFFYGLSHFITFFGIGLVFFVGLLFIRDVPDINPNNVLTAIFAVWTSTAIAGTNFQFIPDVGKAKSSAGRIFKILDEEDQEQKQQRQNSKMLKSGIQGNIQFQKVKFRYPSRHSVILNSLNMKITRQQNVGIVGASGCGKSTINKLLLRLYDIQEGSILIDGVDIKDYDIYFLRSCFSVVRQDPIIFNSSYFDNIRYNCEANQEQIIAAATAANCLDFISIGKTKNLQPSQSSDILLKQFAKLANLKANNLSGGQRQRLAIARAIVRKPKILLLDEATSALDDKNQYQVTRNIQKICKDSTIISITHRYATIKRCDCIFYLQKGENVQEGSFEKLMKLKGKFSNNSSQQLK